MQEPTIVAMGGWPIEPLVAHAVSLRGRRLLYVGTASMEKEDEALKTIEVLRPFADVELLRFNPWPPADLRKLVLDHDVLLIGGGNTLPGSACPHYDGEELRRPVYTRLVGEAGFPPGIALDDGVAAVFHDGELAEVVAGRDCGAVYAVTAEGERRLASRRL